MIAWSRPSNQIIHFLERELAHRLGREPTHSELAGAMGIPVEKVIATRAAARTVTSLERPVGEEGETALGELLEAEQAAPEEEVHVSLRDEALHAALAELPDRQAEVLRLRYGLDGDRQPQSAPEVSRALEMSAKDVLRLEREGLESLAMMREVEALRDAA